MAVFYGKSIFSLARLEPMIRFFVFNVEWRRLEGNTKWRRNFLKECPFSSTILIWLKTFQLIDEIAYKQKTERIMQLLLLSRACFSMCTPNTIQRCNQTKVEVAFDVRCPRAFLSYNSSIRVYFLLSSQKWTLDEEKKKQNRSNSRNERTLTLTCILPLNNARAVYWSLAHWQSWLLLYGKLYIPKDIHSQVKRVKC